MTKIHTKTPNICIAYYGKRKYRECRVSSPSQVYHYVRQIVMTYKIQPWKQYKVKRLIHVSRITVNVCENTVYLVHHKSTLMCVIMCFLLLPTSLKRRRHTSHSNGFSPVCIRKCLVRSLFTLNTFPQMLHECSRDLPGEHVSAAATYMKVIMHQLCCLDSKALYIHSMF